MHVIGIDTGGTFTDFVSYDGERTRIHKVLSTPDAPERAIIQGLHALGLDHQSVRVIHGSTVATNAALEGKGVRTVYITNEGFADILTIGRQTRLKLYDLMPNKAPVPVPAELCLEVKTRMTAEGDVLEALNSSELERLVEQLHALKPQAVAINLLHAYLDDETEKAIEAVIPDDIFVSRSSDVLPLIGEYERGMATWLNSWLGPLVEGYLQRLTRAMAQARISVMQSSGQAIAAEQAAHQAVRMLLSGPAGGLVGAAYQSGLSDRTRLLSFDMGGTSTDVALIDGAPRLTLEGEINGWPVAVPMVDMHTIGAGGGSIAWLDAGGMLHVGPESSGADPGPACYGRGGTSATVTDANLYLGRLRPDRFLGGRMQLNEQASAEAIERLASQMGGSPMQAAEGILAVANQNMAQALRVISVQRGIDPRGFTLVCFGGAGGLHVCALAEALGLDEALMPNHAGVLSALGMLAAPPGRHKVKSYLALMGDLHEYQIEAELKRLADAAMDELVEEGIEPTEIETTYSVDLRYQGQSHSLNMVWQGMAGLVGRFHELHEQTYGHRMDAEVELVAIRAQLSAPALSFHPTNQVDSQPDTIWDEYRGVPCASRDELVTDESFRGPALVLDEVSTLWLADGWRCRKDAAGNLILTRH